MNDEYYQVGVILKPHGVHGEMKIYPTTDEVSRFKNCKDLYLEYKNEMKKVSATTARPQQNLVILKIEGIDTPEEVEKYRQCSLYVTKEHRVKLKKDEYFIADLIGLSAVSDEGEELGKITDVLQTGANDVYVISNEESEIFVPAIKDCILNVDVDNGKMLIHLLGGLR